MRIIGVLVIAVGLFLVVTPTGAAAYDRVVNPFDSCSVSSTTPQYNTLQDAVNAANAGDQIGVCPGTYDQTVSINKSVTFTAIGYVLIKPSQGGTCFHVLASNVTVRYFVIQGCDTAIWVEANGALIQNNQLQFNTNGILMIGTNNIVQNNLIQDGTVGVAAASVSDGTAITNNTLRRLSAVGIELISARGVIVNKNSVQHGCNGTNVPASNINVNNGGSCLGILAVSSNDSIISFNSVSFNALGIALLQLGSGNQIMRNVVTRSTVVDCFWDTNGTPVFSDNTCGTEIPAGAWD